MHGTREDQPGFRAIRSPLPYLLLNGFSGGLDSSRAGALQGPEDRKSFGLFSNSPELDGWLGDSDHRNLAWHVPATVDVPNARSVRRDTSL